MKSVRVKAGDSIDGLFRNKVRVIQSARGYRVSEDTLILTWFVKPRPNALILDAGTGSGAIAFGLATREPSVTVIGLEIQQGLCDRARRGVLLNRLEAKVFIVRGDLRQASAFFRPGCFDAVVSNPPYHEPGRGRLNVQEEKAVARHQLMMPLPDLFRVSARLLKPDGRISIIYPAAKLDQIRKAMKETGFAPLRMVWIHPRPAAAAGLVCVEAGLGVGVGDLIEGSLFLYDVGGERTWECEAIFAGEDIPAHPVQG